MNKQKRAKLREATSLLEKAKILISSVKDREQDDLDNCPENLQDSERYSTMENAIDEIEENVSMIQEIVAKVKLLISERLNDYFGESWLIKWLPKNIYTRAKGEADEAMYIHVTNTGEEIDIPVWDYVTLPECK